MRVGIVALLQETNTFVNGRTTLKHFERDVLLDGEAVREHFSGTAHEMGGFLAELEATGIEAVPLFAARALPYGTVDDDTYAELRRRLLAAVDRAGPLDGLLLAPHGATVARTTRDVDGEWMKAVREAVGPDTPLVATADPHANLSPAMVNAVDALIAYRTNPHVDQFARGREAARLLLRSLHGDIRPTTAATYPSMVIPIDRQCTDEEPCASIVRRLEELRRRDDVLSASLFLGFPYADVPEMGSAVVVVTDDDPTLAQRLAEDVAGEFWSRRDEFRSDLVSVDSAIERAAEMEGPVLLLDMGDNVGGGSPADGTHLAHALHRSEGLTGFVCIDDPGAVQQVEAAGLGATVEMEVGGRTDDLHGPPLSASFEVLDVRDGRFREPEPRHGGIRDYDQGRTAIVRSNSLTIMLTSRRMVPFSLHQLTDLGVDPSGFDVIVAKGVNAPLAAYRPVCASVIRVDTPGVTTCDVTRLEYVHRRRPMFPFESTETSGVTNR